MGLYYKKNKIAGINFLPRLTMAEYNNMEIKPQYWIRTDSPNSYLRIASSEVGYSNTTSGLTATNVQDAIDELARMIQAL